jgi:hypothetical protein
MGRKRFRDNWGTTAARPSRTVREIAPLSLRRDQDRFPAEFLFQLTADESSDVLRLRSQIVTLKAGRGHHRKYLPFAFTEHGACAVRSFDPRGSTPHPRKTIAPGRTAPQKQPLLLRGGSGIIPTIARGLCYGSLAFSRFALRTAGAGPRPKQETWRALSLRAAARKHVCAGRANAGAASEILAHSIS